MCVTCGILAGRRSAVGSSSERSSVCQPRCSRATSHQPRQPRQPECLSKQYICTFHSGYESRISKWFVTCCYSCFFRFESSSESIQASNLEAERMIWSHIESSYHGYGEFQGNLPGSVCWASKLDPCVFAVSKRPCGGRDWSAPRNSPQDHGPPQGQHRTVPTPHAVNSEVAASLSRGCWFSLIFTDFHALCKSPSSVDFDAGTLRLPQPIWACDYLGVAVVISPLCSLFMPRQCPLSHTHSSLGACLAASSRWSTCNGRERIGEAPGGKAQKKAQVNRNIWIYIYIWCIVYVYIYNPHSSPIQQGPWSCRDQSHLLLQKSPTKRGARQATHLR